MKSGEQSGHFEAEIYKDPSQKFIYYEIDKDRSMGILTLTACKENAEYHKILAQFFEEVQSNNIQNVVLDLRENNGGWIPVSKDFMEYIDVDSYRYCNNLLTRMGPFWYREKEQIRNQKVDNAFDGKIFVLTSAKTFSAAMDFAMVIKDNGLGTIVGETCGNMPDSYTANQKYQLPNSKLKLVVSILKQNRFDESKSGEPLVPDYEVDPLNALQKVYELVE